MKMASFQAAVRVDSLEAWRAPLGGFLAQFFQIGYARSSGLLLLALSDDYDVPYSILLPTSVLNIGLDKMLAPVAERLSALVGLRITVILASLFSALCTSGIFFIPITSASVILIIGVGLGIGNSFSSLPVMHAVSISFKNRRGIAMSFVKCGVSLGSIALPPLFVYLSETYGSRGAFLITSSFFLHLLISAALLPAYVIDGTTNEVLLKPQGCPRFCTVKAKDEIEDSKSKVSSLAKRPLVTRLIALIFYGITVVFSMAFFIQTLHVYPLFAAEVGLPRYTIALTMSLLSGVDFFLRLATGYVSDQFSNSGRLLIMGVSFFIDSIMVLLLALFKCSTVMAFVFCTIFPVGLAQMSTGWIPILIGFTDVTHFPRAVSLVYMGVGIATVASVFGIKFLVSVFNSYFVFVLIYGFGLLFCSVCLIILGLLFNRCQAQPASHTDDEEVKLNEIES